jgi:hypothetical protein
VANRHLTLLHVQNICLQEARYIAGVQRFDFDRELAPYDLNRYSQWVSLSCHISKHVLQELLPVSKQQSVIMFIVECD